jgi:hypothetical protein
MRQARFRAIVAVCSGAGVVGLAEAQPCVPTWDGRFNYSALNSPLLCSVVYDDGTGPSFYIGGDVTADGTSVGFSRWDGQRLVPIAPGINGRIERMAVWDDDGPGPRRPGIYALGRFQIGDEPYGRARMMRWDGAWSAVPGIFEPYPEFKAVAVHHDGMRERLYVGGRFASIDGQPYSNIAAFDGTGWSSVGNGVSSTTVAAAVNALASFTDASGPALYVGGWFNRSGPISAASMGKFQNNQWQYTDGVFDETLPTASAGGVNAIVVADPLRTGTPTLVIAGYFYRMDGRAMSGLAMRTPLGDWVPVGPLPNIRTSVHRLFSADLGAGRSLFAVTNNRGLEEFDGQQWSSVESSLAGAVGNWTVLNTGPLDVVCATGLGSAGITALPGGGLFDGTSWTPLGGFGLGFNSWVYKLIKGDIGGGEELFAFGGFTHAGTTYVDGSARWTGTSWEPIGFGLPEEELGATDAVIFDDGGGAHLYVASEHDGIYRLDGGVWGRVGQLQQTTLYSPSSTRLVIYDPDDSGPQPASLYAAGRFFTAEPEAWSPLARLVAGSWELLTAPPGYFYDYQVHDAEAASAAITGSSPAILISGRFEQDIRFSLLRWNGLEWSRDGVEFQPQGISQTHMVMTTHDDGAGEALYIAGSFASSPAVRLRGGEWSPYGGTATISSWMGSITELRSVQLPEGRLLMLSGDSGAISSPSILRVDSLEPYPYRAYAAYTAVDYDDGSGPALFMGGSLSFTVSPGFASVNQPAGIAMLHFCPPTCTPDFNGDGDVGTDADIEAFFACLGGRCCDRCGSSDFNNDGDTGTDADIESFFRVLSGQVC